MRSGWNTRIYEMSPWAKVISHRTIMKLSPQSTQRKELYV